MKDLRTEIKEILKYKFDQPDTITVLHIVDLIRKHLPAKKEYPYVEDVDKAAEIEIKIDSYNSAIDEMNRRLG